MFKFVRQDNIQRFERLLVGEADTVVRARLERLLAEERAKDEEDYTLVDPDALDEPDAETRPQP